jgi:hypothetical protein
MSNQFILETGHGYLYTSDVDWDGHSVVEEESDEKNFLVIYSIKPGAFGLA